MLKFNINSDRAAEALSVLDFLSITSGKNKDAAYRLVSRFLLDKDGKYIVKVTLDKDGDIEKFENTKEALLQMTAVTPKRLEQLAKQLMEAANDIVNPPNAGGLSGPTSTDTKKPPSG